MKKTLITTIGIGLMLMVSTISFAQDTKTEPTKKEAHQKLTPEEKATKRTEKMTKHLELSEDQAQKIHTINLDYANKMEAHKKEMQKIKAKIKSEREKAKSEIDKILTDEQKVKLEEMKKKKQANKKEHQGKHKHNCEENPKCDKDPKQKE